MKILHVKLNEPLFHKPFVFVQTLSLKIAQSTLFLSVDVIENDYR